jgi:hypothetical protein
MIAFKDLWLQHPANHSMATPCIAPHDLTSIENRQIKRGLPVFGNQCAIRMGVCLKRAGVAPTQLGRVSTCYVHPAEEMHFIRASELAGALTSTKLPGVAPVERITGKDAAAFYPKLFGRTGIIYIQDYWARTTDQPGNPTGDHIDVWNGFRPSTKWLMEWFSWLGYYSNYAEAKEVWFWEVK